MTTTAAHTPATRHRPRLSSPPTGTAPRTLGADMQVLDLIEQLLVASKHPDIAAVERYGPGLGPWGQTKETSKVVRRSSALAQVRAEFKRCRDAGLERRHASKLARNRTARPLV